MTTKFLRQYNLHFQNSIGPHGVSHENKRFRTIFLSAPKAPPPAAKRRKFYFHCRLAFSDFRLGSEKSAQSFLAKSFSETPSGHGHPHLRVQDVLRKKLYFPALRAMG